MAKSGMSADFMFNRTFFTGIIAFFLVFVGSMIVDGTHEEATRDYDAQHLTFAKKNAQIAAQAEEIALKNVFWTQMADPSMADPEMQLFYTDVNHLFLSEASMTSAEVLALLDRMSIGYPEEVRENGYFFSEPTQFSDTFRSDLLQYQMVGVEGMVQPVPELIDIESELGVRPSVWAKVIGLPGLGVWFGLSCLGYLIWSFIAMSDKEKAPWLGVFSEKAPFSNLLFALMLAPLYTLILGVIAVSGTARLGSRAVGGAWNMTAGRALHAVSASRRDRKNPHKARIKQLEAAIETLRVSPEAKTPAVQRSIQQAERQLAELRALSNDHRPDSVEQAQQLVADTSVYINACREVEAPEAFDKKRRGGQRQSVT